MRLFAMTITSVAALSVMLVLPIQAQQAGGVPPYMSLPTEKEHVKKDESHAEKADEKAYKSALDGIRPAKNFDPWSNVRQKPQSNNSRQQ